MGLVSVSVHQYEDFVEAGYTTRSDQESGISDLVNIVCEFSDFGVKDWQFVSSECI